LFGCENNPETNNINIDYASCNGYNSSAENLQNAFDNNESSYAVFTLYGGSDASFEHININFPKQYVSKLYMVSNMVSNDSNPYKACIVAWYINEAEKKYENTELYKDTSFNFPSGKNYTINSFCNMIDVYISSTSERQLNIYTIILYDSDGNQQPRPKGRGIKPSARIK